MKISWTRLTYKLQKRIIFDKRVVTTSFEYEKILIFCEMKIYSRNAFYAKIALTFNFVAKYYDIYSPSKCI